MHEYIYIQTYKHNTYCTYKHSKIHSFTLVHTHYNLSIYSSIFLLHTYIHCDSLSAASSIASSSARFLPVALLLTFSFFLFLDWAKNITHIRTVRFGSVRFGFKHLVVTDCSKVFSSHRGQVIHCLHQFFIIIIDVQTLKINNMGR